MGALELSRRTFLKATAAAGGLTLTAGWTSVFAQDKYGANSMPHGAVDNPLVFVSIAANGIVTITCHRAEMGQGVRTGVPMIVADELEADWRKVRVVQAPGDELRYGNQDTDGSRTTRHFFMPMRRCGAAARQMLEAAAAARWGVPASEVQARNHELVHKPSGRKVGFGDVAADAAKQPVPAADQLRLKKPAEFRYIGKGEVPIGLAWLKGLTLRLGLANVIAHVDRVLALIEAGKLDPAPLVTHRMKLDEAEEAYRIYDNREALKVVLTP